MVDFNSRERFSTRVDDYVRYRPGYPPEMIDHLFLVSGLKQDAVVADIGSGTGISAALFLDRVKSVFAVEPNPEMRIAAEGILGDNAGFISINGSAENTTLENHSVDLAIAAQAFHWFDIPKTSTELKRILKPPFKAALSWNERETRSTPFLIDYEQLLMDHAIDYKQVNHSNLKAPIFDDFYRHHDWNEFNFPNSQKFGFEGIKGRLLSSSYVPGRNDDGHQPMILALEKLFNKYSRNGIVEIRYTTRLYYGCIAG